ncbi:MAG: NAD(P)H-binding protein [Nakamurella sp.]
MIGVKVIVFGATGMIGQAMLAQCLGDDGVDEVLVVGRSTVGRTDDKLREILHRDFTDFSALADDFAGSDACFYCLGVSSVRMKEADYRRVTKDFALAAARVIAAAAPHLVFLYISGMGTDSSETGRVMWARVKGETENALLAMPFQAYAVRPGFIQAVGGVRSKTPLYAALYRISGWLYPVVRKVAPNYAIRSDELAAAMIEVAKRRPANRILESTDLRALI